MKIFIFALLLAVLVIDTHQHTFSELTQIWHASVLRHSEKCLMESGADPEIAMRVIRHGEYVNDHKVMCFVRCLAENLVIIYPDGSIHLENLLDAAHVKDPTVVGHFEKCLDLQKIPDHCEKAYRISECLFKSTDQAMKDNSK